MENAKCFRLRRMLPVVMSFSWLAPDSRVRRNLAMILTLLLVATVQAATTWYVDDDQKTDDGDGSTWETAKQTIQAAIHEAEEGDIILVNDGSYEPIWTENKAITIRSVNGPNATIIDGGGEERCATLGELYSSEYNTILEGFTLQNGSTLEPSSPPAPPSFGGGALGGTLVNCILKGNTSDGGGGGACSSNLINCIFTDNISYSGGGACDCSLQNCLLTYNGANDGGGAYECTLSNCTLTKNSAFGSGAGGVEFCSLRNCIVWENWGIGAVNYANSEFTYSCSNPLPSGIGNIGADPCFADAEQDDYRLTAASPCLNTGSNEFTECETDLAGNPRISNDAVDMGVYETAVFVITVEIQGHGEVNPIKAVVKPGNSATFAATETAGSFRHFEIDGVVVSELPTYTWENIQADGVITAVFNPKTWYVDDDQENDDGDGSTWATAKKTIQAAINEAEEGDTILVNDGTYEPIWTGGKLITIRSVNGPQKTVIDGGGIERCATLEYTDSILEGFTLEDGYAEDGGGACGGTLINCILIRNHADWEGGGACDSTLINCTLSQNSARSAEYGSYYEWGDGGGAYGCNLRNCTLNNNLAVYGGGAYSCTLTNCILTKNSVQGKDFDGVRFGDGGGAYYSALTNCTLWGNKAQYGFGGGAYYSDLFNCIIWGNSASEGANYDSSLFQFTCTAPLPTEGEGNLSEDPRFVDATNGNFQLRAGSPCIDSGSNEFADSETDRAGNPRVGNGTVDMGAYEGGMLIITGQVQGRGLIDPPRAVVENGNSVTFQAVETFKTFSHFEINGVVVSELPTYIWENIQADGVITAVFDPKTWYVDDDQKNDDGDGSTWETAKKTIQAAINEAVDGDIILVNDGSYEPILINGKSITIRSVNGAEKTIIDGGGIERCATLEESSSIMEGFTLQNGYAKDGGGAIGGTLNNCTLTENRAWDNGGGTYDCTLTNCTLTGNMADGSGGGAYQSQLTNCTVTGNKAAICGGVYECDLYNSIAWDNSVFETENPLANFDRNHLGGWIQFSCTEPLPAEGEGNLSVDPKFVDVENADYRLRSDSPCVDSGNNEFVDGETDLAGNPRISNDTVDMGAYEGGVEGFVISGRVQGKGLLSPLTAVVASGGSAIFTATETHGSFRHFEIDGVVVSELPTCTLDNIQADGVITAVFNPKTWYVDDDQENDDGDGSTWATAKKNIQAAINEAEEGDTILVNDGTYEPIWTENKATTIRSVNGAEKTIIDGSNIERCATFLNSSAILEGFTLQNGYAEEGGGANGGTLTKCTLNGNQAVFGGGASYSEMTNCTLNENEANFGGGAYECGLVNCTLTGNQAEDGGGANGGFLTNCTLTGNQAGDEGGGASYSEMTNCTLTGNQAEDGGGAYECGLVNCALTGNRASAGGGAYDCILTNCTLTGNQADYGGGAYECGLVNCALTGNQADTGGGACNGALTNCALTGNRASDGGGAYNGALTNCALTGNQADTGGGAYECGLVNCTVTGNSATISGGGVIGCLLSNCIVWDNSAPEDANYRDSLFSYSCTSPLPDDGEGNISSDPKLVDAANAECRLRSGSPCLNVGSNDFVEFETDLAGNPRISNDTVDMGAYEGGVEGFVISGRIQGKGLLSPLTAVVASGGSAIFTATETAGFFSHFEIDGVVVSELPTYTWENIQADGVITAVFDPKTWYVDASKPDDYGDGRTWESAMQSIQTAIDATEDDDIILVTDGTYLPIDTANKAITIRSVNGAEKTIIDGGGVERCATLGDYGSGRKTVLDGFTLQNGYAEEGGGACGGTLRHCTLTNNGSPALIWYDQSFDFYWYNGGGAYDCALSYCLVQNNTARDGGGVSECVLDNCVLANNTAGVEEDESYGGGAYDSILTNCTLTGNQAYYGGGAESSTLTNCTLTGNLADSGGGANGGILTNCTLTGNQANSGGGIAFADARNCIIWGNSAQAGTNYDESSLEHSCTYPLPSEGAGNISSDPRFVDVVNGNFRLRTSSPCMDAGDNNLVTAGTDLAGNPRISNEVVDMGAYEGAVDGCVISGRVQGNGTLFPLTAVVAQGGSVTFTATATDGAFRHFAVDGVVVSESPTYAWNNIQADGVITAVFATGTWYVNADRPDDSGDGLTWTTALQSIQTAVDRANAGDVILVNPGVYAPIVTDNKAITIRSVNGAAATVINGGGRQRCATLSESQFERQTVLDGFTLQNGTADCGGGLYGGTVLNCHITNCLAEGNEESERERGGGGASHATLSNCTLDKNLAPVGGGAYASILSNCTIAGNTAQDYGGGVSDCSVFNSIVWNNQAENEANYSREWGEYTTAMYFSCSDPLPPGEGNVSDEPRFIDALHGDFRLRTGSPCVDAGNNVFVESATDLAGNPRIANDLVDMGALEGRVGGWVISGRVQGNGTISPLTAVVEPGSSVTIHAANGAGIFQHFLIDGEIVSRSPDFTWENIENDGIITAVFTSVTWHVDGTRPDDDGDGLSRNTAKKTIQAALDAAIDGDLILVNAGVYEPIDGQNKAVTIRSLLGAEDTIIDGGGAQRCALAATLEGFTLQNGLAKKHGGGAFDCALNQCILSGNTAAVGGGAASSTLSNCLLTGNTAADGGGAHDCTLSNCTVAGNSAEEWWGAGGVSYCTLWNCIVWDNSGYAFDNYDDSELMYSCSYPWPDGAGNISVDPEFIDAASGVYHLRMGSPCIDNGSNDYVQGNTDLAGDARLLNEIVDIGAYERNTDNFVVLGQAQGRGKISPRTAHVPPGGSVTFTAEETTARFLHFQIDDEIVSTTSSFAWNEIEDDGVITAVFAPATLYVDAARPDDNGDGLSWSTAKKGLQSAVMAAHDGETILVRAGCYAPINTGRKSLVIRGIDGAKATIIDGGGTRRCATLGGEWSEDSTLLEGFTLQNGFAENGGGATGGQLNRCIISGNTADEDGGGAYECRLSNCVLSRNYVQFGRGGGAYACQLSNCTLVGNAASIEGGGISQCKSSNCIVWDNIVWDNLAAQAANHTGSQLSYSCTVPLPNGGEDGNNISENPLFVDAVNGDFRVRVGSPCVNAGDYGYDSGDRDLAGNWRFQGHAMDIGAYEGSVTGYVISGRVQGDGVLLPMTFVVPPGGSSWFEAVETGSGFQHFLIEGEVVSEASTYSWKNVQADGVITAVFATAIWHVDAFRPDDNGDGRNWETAKKTIQAAVESAGKDDLILVNPGIYEPFVANIHPLVIRSVQGPEATIIDAAGKTRCATLGNEWGEAGTLLEGFTLRHGLMGEGGGAMGGTLNNCLLTDNLAYNGGGAAYCTLNNCTLTGNSARTGGGAWTSALTQCTLTGNTADDDGGGAVSSILTNCTLTDNSAADFGGGSISSTLNNCLLTGNSAQYCGGATDCRLTNCTVSKNTAEKQYGGTVDCTLYNSIVWGNTAAQYENQAYSTFYFSCTDPWVEGENNLNENPMFVDPANGDYRLAAISPCVNRGNNSFAVGETDLAGNPRIRAGYVDMGALEAERFIIIVRIQGLGWLYPSEEAIPIPVPQEDGAFGVIVAPGASVTFEAIETGRSFRYFLVDGAVVSGAPTYTWENIQADGVITAVFESKTWYVDDDQDGDGSSWEAALQSIQAAVDTAEDGDIILVNDGIYAPIWTENKAITIRSVNGAETTFINGWWQERCATLADDSSDQTILDGFTLQNGYAEYGGGAYGGTLSNCTLTENAAEMGGGACNSTLTNCTLTGNSADWGGGAYNSTLNNCTLTENEAGSGGGAYISTLNNCTLTGNAAETGGGASDSTLTNCTLTENEADGGAGATWCILANCTLIKNAAWYSGGGAEDCDLINCTLTENFSYYDGGSGAYYSTLTNCTLKGNLTAERGGGAQDSFLTNCLLIDNFARFGGGAAYCTLTNCTLSSNTAWEEGGGASDCALANCIVWGNTAPAYANYCFDDDDDEDNLYDELLPGDNPGLVYCCAYPLAEGDGNINAEPMFVDAANGDFRLRAGSPCANAGNNLDASGNTDLVGNPRLANGRIDMGAYEGVVAGFVLSAQVQGYGEITPRTVVASSGQDAVFQAKNNGRPFRHFLVNGAVVSGSSSYNWTNIRADGVIIAVFGNTVWYVDATRPDDNGDGMSWPTAKKTIQAAVEAAVDGDEIVVNDGLYEPITTDNKEITIRSVNGPAMTIINGGDYQRCATLSKGLTNRQTVLEGFTLQNGIMERYVKSEEDGTYTLTYVCEDGGGAQGGTLFNCILRNNTAKSGGGAAYCTLNRCTLTGNFASHGLGEYDYEGDGDGGGAYGCVLNNCFLANNLADRNGGGADYSILTNCTLVGNSDQIDGGIGFCTLQNCILWNNNTFFFDSYGDSTCFFFCCTQQPTPAGEGNISAEPCFVDAANGDYRLRAGSPCIDAGSNEFVMFETDLAENPRVGNEVVDMGAYEGAVGGIVISGRVQGNGTLSPMTAVVAFGGSATFTATETDGAFRHFEIEGVVVSESLTYTCTNIQTDGVITAVFETKTWHVDGSRPDDNGDGRSWETAMQSLQTAIDAAGTGDLILVQDGIYAPITTRNKGITIQSVNGQENTIIDGGGKERCATMGRSGLERDTILDGFTLTGGQVNNFWEEIWPILPVNIPISTWMQNGYAEGYGGAAYGGTLRHCTLIENVAKHGGGAYGSTLNNCTLTGNSANWHGGGAYGSTLNNCLLTENWVDYSGGGACGSTVNNCTLTGNSADDGGGAYVSTLTNCTLTGNSADHGGGANGGTLTNCTLTENSANWHGGGAYGSTLNNCLLTENWVDYSGGGAYGGTLTNCTLTGNSANRDGGGACGSTVNNCTLTGNSANRDGGGANGGTLTNCIVWGNTSEAHANYFESNFEYSCSDPLPAGEGNISEDPLFVDVESSDFRLSAGSPCIDAGSNAYAAGDVDLAGNPRILYGVVDMGANEFTSMSALPDGKYDWLSGWNALYLPFDSLDQDTSEELAEMPVFKLSGNTYVKEKQVSLHTPLWIFCEDPEFAPVLQGTLTSGMPADPLDIPVGQWTPVGAECRIVELPDEYVAWEWRDGRYTCIQSLQPGHVYFIYRSNIQ